jgi:hypothetical protein
MKCHYTYDKEAGKVLIPGCMAVAVHGSMSYCTCRPEKELTFAQFERQEYNKIVADLREQIKSLEKENARLERTLGKIYSKRPK